MALNAKKSGPDPVRGGIWPGKEAWGLRVDNPRKEDPPTPDEKYGL